MLKSEMVFLEIFRGAKTQKEIAEKLCISLSTVNNAVKPLARIGAIEKRNFGFRLIDKEKALAFWASARNLEKDIVYKTRANLPVTEIERLMPSGVVFTAFTAFRLKFREVPADYSEVYVYAKEEELVELKKRFPKKDGPANIIVLLEPEKFMTEKIVPNELLFADLWNLKEWYAKEFLNKLKQKMKAEQ
ncbi:MarR family transcriptional regulator [Candidatus Micrarchaeota archaeon]|nr:MarR family transcriptional regulator [Candidatus Micrarchaeota archaeon]MBU2476055.1 MarR family transcriptional regulator [Candidatus Micrarchaeota archaeon]